MLNFPKIAIFLEKLIPKNCQSWSDLNILGSLVGYHPVFCPQILTWANTLLGFLWISKAKMMVLSKKKNRLQILLPTE